MIRPEDTRHIALGKDNWTRTSEIILDEKFDSEHLYIGEGMIPSGNWSGWPAHRHDVDDPPRELDMEETYFYLFDPPQGFGFQSVYQPDGSLNEAYRVQAYGRHRAGLPSALRRARLLDVLPLDDGRRHRPRARLVLRSGARLDQRQLTTDLPAGRKSTTFSPQSEMDARGRA